MQRHEFEKLAMAEINAVYRFALFLTQNSDATDELVQDVYARAFRPVSIERFGSRGAGMRSWLMTMARHLFYGHLKHARAGQRAVSAVAGDTVGADGSLEAFDAHEIPEIDPDLAGKRLREALAAMSPELREVLWFWGVEGLKYREISEALDVPIGTVMSRLHRARSRAAKFLRSDAALAPQLARAGLISTGTAEVQT